MVSTTTPSDPPPIRGRFDGRTHLFPVRVYYEDTDLSGIVYHANYLRYCERARSDMLREAGIDQRSAIEAGQGAYAIAAMDLRFLAPARLDDALTVESTTESVTAARVVIHQTVRRGAVNLLTAHVTAAFLSPAGRPRRQPADWIAAFQPLLPNGAP